MPTDIALTLGNPNGIGPEISAKAVSGLTAADQSRILVIGDPFSLQNHFSSLPEISTLSVPVEGFSPRPGDKDPRSGRASFAYLEAASGLIRQGRIRAVVTAPISKELVVASGVRDFTDHTTYFSRLFSKEPASMLFYSPVYSMILATIHIPISRVAVELCPETLQRTLRRGIDFCRKIYRGQTLKVAVCGLNPHAGESGLLGDEEKNWMCDLVRNWHEPGVELSGPLPADTVFMKAEQRAFHLVVAMYHDQGLAPFKTLHFADGVNVSLGLPFVRTSPDHGTAFEIAGKGIADASSLESALRLAFRLTENS